MTVYIIRLNKAASEVSVNVDLKRAKDRPLGASAMGSGRGRRPS